MMLNFRKHTYVYNYAELYMDIYLRNDYIIKYAWDENSWNYKRIHTVL